MTDCCCRYGVLPHRHRVSDHTRQQHCRLSEKFRYIIGNQTLTVDQALPTTFSDHPLLLRLVYRTSVQWQIISGCRPSSMNVARTECFLSARSLQTSRCNCNESGRHFRICLLENWTDLDKTCQRGGKRGKRDPVKFWRHRSRSRREWGKIPTFFVMNTTHPFSHFRFIDFRETWQEYVNQCPHESFCSEILKRVAFLQKLIFR